MFILSVYDGQKNLRLVDEFTSLTLSSVLAGVTLAGVLYLTYRDISRALFLLFILTAYLSLLGWRLIARPLYHRLRVLRKRIRPVLIVGAGFVGMEVEKKVLQWEKHGLHCVGFLDDDPVKEKQQKKVLGSVSAARELIKAHHITDVVVALPLRAYARIEEVARQVEDLPVL